MSLYKTFKTDTDKEVDGIWVPLDEDVVFKIARAGGQNSAYQKYFAKLIRPYRRQIDNNTLPQEKQTAMMADAFGRCVVLDWQQREHSADGKTWKLKEHHIMDGDGNWLIHSPENVTKVLIDLPDLFSTVREVAMEHSAFQTEEEDADAKK